MMKATICNIAVRQRFWELLPKMGLSET